MGTALRRRLALAVAIAVGLLLSGILVWQASEATFSSSSRNDPNTFTAGHLVLTNDRNGTAMFSATGLKPGDGESRCIDITYSGNLPAAVNLTARWAAADPTSPLAPYLTFAIDEISAAAACTASASAVRPVYAGNTTLRAKVDALQGRAAGLAWTATGTAPETKRYRFTYSLQDTNAAQDKTAGVSFIWTATTVEAVTAAGTFQTAIGCAQNWDPACTRAQLTDPDGDQIHTWTTTAIPAGTYQFKVALNRSWTENYGAGGVSDGPNIPFTVPSGGARVTLSYDRTDNSVSVVVTPL